jgi:antitoxin (DNA-binding transcriptional repressor) of toxin-antitoxin stability system
MLTVKMHEAKTQLSRLIASVEAGEEVTIMRGDQPVARLVAVPKDLPARRPGRLKGQMIIHDGFFDPLPEDELRHWEGRADENPA